MSQSVNSKCSTCDAHIYNNNNSCGLCDSSSLFSEFLMEEVQIDHYISNDPNYLNFDDYCTPDDDSLELSDIEDPFSFYDNNSLHYSDNEEY